MSLESYLLWHAEIPSNATVTTKNKVQKVGEKAGMRLSLVSGKGNGLVVAGLDEGAATVDDSETKLATAHTAASRVTKL